MFLEKKGSPEVDSYDMLVSSFVSILVLLSSVFIIVVVFKSRVMFLNWALYCSAGITLFASVMAVSKASRGWAKIAFFGAILPYIWLLLNLVGILLFLFALWLGSGGDGSFQ